MPIPPRAIPGLQAYRNAAKEPAARWLETIDRFDQAPATILHAPKFRLSSEDRFFCIGSCFARNIEEQLIGRKATVLSKRIICSQAEYPNRPNGIVNKFTTASMLNEVHWALDPPGRPGAGGEASIFEGANGAHDLQLVPHAPPVSLAQAYARRQYLEGDYFARLAQADVVIVTLGLIETWRDEATGIWLNAPPPFYLAKREPDRFQLVVTSVEQNVLALEALRDRLKIARPQARFVVTVSPVPMDTTFTGEDVFVANARSKSVLRAAAGQFCDRHDDVAYFPSYELVTATDRARAYAADKLHVRAPIVARIVDLFCSLYAPELAPADPHFVEALYLAANPDIDDLVRRGELESGYAHWFARGRDEARPLRPTNPPQWIFDAGILDPPNAEPGGGSQAGEA
jgi:hypothetical protein